MKKALLKTDKRTVDAVRRLVGQKTRKKSISTIKIIMLIVLVEHRWSTAGPYFSDAYAVSESSGYSF